MHDTNPHGDEQALAFQALLYASGDLENAESHAFEARLAEDQAAREALAEAVHLTGALAGPPDPSWRSQARERLQPSPSVWQGLLNKRPYHGHPAFWCLLGALAAALLIVAMPPAPTPTPVVHDRVPEPTVEAANLWAELHNSDHLARAHTEEARRKSRAEDRRLAKPEDRKLRAPFAPSSKH